MAQNSVCKFAEVDVDEKLPRPWCANDRGSAAENFVSAAYKTILPLFIWNGENGERSHFAKYYAI